MQFKNRYLWVLATCIQTALVCFSCAVSEVSHREESSTAWDLKTSEQVLQRLRHDQGKIIDLAAAFSLSVDPPTAGQPSSMRGVLFFSKRLEQSRLRIKALGVFGRTLFDLLQKGNDLQIYVPSRKTLYLGKADSTLRSQNGWSEMLTTMFADYSELKTSPQADLTFKDGLVTVPLVHGKIIIDPETGLVRERHEPEQVVFYNRYEQEPGLPPIPTHIEVRKTDSGSRAVCRLSQLKVNSHLSDVFDLSAYDPEVFRDLKALETKKP